MSYLTKYSHATGKANTADMECHAARHDALAQGRSLLRPVKQLRRDELKQPDENLPDPWPK
jgi:hypothetical protein